MEEGQGSVTGVIIPPPDVRAVVDKTAQFVAKNGKSFEEKIRGSADGKSNKFKFMNPMDPYFTYYERKIQEFEGGEAVQMGVPRAGDSEEKGMEVDGSADQNGQTHKEDQIVSSSTARAGIANPLGVLAQHIPTEAPDNFEFILAQPPSITAADMDVIMITAQYTAINGRVFLAGVNQREQRNPQFDFLKPTHHYFQYFTALVDQYMKASQQRPRIRNMLSKREDVQSALKEVTGRWTYDNEEERKRQIYKGEVDAGVGDMVIDWQDFTIVETISFDEDSAATSSAAAVHLTGTATTTGGEDGSDEDMDMDDDMDEDMEEDEEEELNVVQNYVPKVGAGQSDTMLLDPVSGKPVPAGAAEQHMKVQLMDPQWKEQKQRFLEKQKTTNVAAGDSITNSLKRFAQNRSDIFAGDAAGASSTLTDKLPEAGPSGQGQAQPPQPPSKKSKPQ